MSTKDPKKLIRFQAGGLPLLHAIIERMKLRDVLSQYLPTHGNETVSVVDTLILLVYNLVLGKEPLYHLGIWVDCIDLKCVHLNQYAENQFSDDRFGRALDKLYKVDRASMMTEIVLHVIDEFDIQMERLHNDSTTIKAYGEIPGTTKTGLSLQYGHSKDHRPDLKQLLYTLTISSDGAVPVHYKTYPGNRTDDTTHIETWKTLRKICGKPDFLYVANCKVCTNEQLKTIVDAGGRVVTIIPETWKEVDEFKENLRSSQRSKTEILRVKKTGLKNTVDYFSCFDGDYKTENNGYRIHWIFSTEKKKRDHLSREKQLKKAEIALTKLNGRINRYNLKTAEEIENAAKNILKEYHVHSFMSITIGQAELRSTQQVRTGRPGKDTQYKTKSKFIHTLLWYRDQESLKKEQHLDGIFPLLSTDSLLSSKEVLQAYKYQPKIETRFSQFKNVHNGAPLLFKNIERVDANMFAFFLSLMVQSLLEREVRKAMLEQNIQSLDIYPEERASKFPTTSCIMNVFERVSRCQIFQGNNVLEEYKDDLTTTQLQILSLVDIKERTFWNNN